MHDYYCTAPPFTLASTAAVLVWTAKGCAAGAGAAAESAPAAGGGDGSGGGDEAGEEMGLGICPKHPQIS
eukprot:68203-Pelagomonas_calceolata.AAC.5